MGSLWWVRPVSMGCFGNPRWPAVTTAASEQGAHSCSLSESPCWPVGKARIPCPGTQASEHPSLADAMLPSLALGVPISVAVLLAPPALSPAVPNGSPFELCICWFSTKEAPLSSPVGCVRCAPWCPRCPCARHELFMPHSVPSLSSIRVHH